MIAAAALGGGFADAVFDAQSVFRSVLDAMARPGRIIELRQCVTPPAPLLPTAGAIVAALADEGTPVFLDGVLATAEVAEWLTFHTGAAVVNEPGKADFAVIGNPLEMPEFGAFRQGSDEYPDRSATVILQVERLAQEPLELALTGPGIADREHLSAHPLPDGFPTATASNRARFPCGIDFILTSRSRIAALPRSVRIRDMRAG